MLRPETSGVTWAPCCKRLRAKRLPSFLSRELDRPPQSFSRGPCSEEQNFQGFGGGGVVVLHGWTSRLFFGAAGYKSHLFLALVLRISCTHVATGDVVGQIAVIYP